MYLHLGQDTVIKTRDILGIFDIDTTSVSKHTREYLNRAQKKNEVVNVTLELPKSFIVAQNGDKQTVYISQISASTLKKRSGYFEDIKIEKK